LTAGRHKALLAKYGIEVVVGDPEPPPEPDEKAERKARA
jgi:hypothetical protein